MPLRTLYCAHCMAQLSPGLRSVHDYKVACMRPTLGPLQYTDMRIFGSNIGAFVSGIKFAPNPPKIIHIFGEFCVSFRFVFPVVNPR